jgi:hypothetical protein
LFFFFRFMASAAELQKIFSEYTSRAKTFNITCLAVSALIKKLAIINFPFDQLAEPEIVEFAKYQLEDRFQRIFVDLVEARTKLIEQDFMIKLEIELFRLKMELEAADEVDENHLILYETCLEVSRDIKRMAVTDVPEIVNWCRAKCLSGHMLKVADINSFLETELEQKLHLDIFTV